MRQKRLFLGLAFEGLAENPELKKLLGKLKRTVAEKDKDVKWAPKENWHVTLVFLGNLPDERAELAQTLLTEKWSVPQVPVTLDFHGLGAFADIESARTLWLGLGKSQELLDLQSSLESLYRENGFYLDDRPYRPHLTLARFRNPLNARELVGLGGRKSFGEFAVKEVILFDSVMQGHYPKYTPIARRVLS